MSELGLSKQGGLDGRRLRKDGSKDRVVAGTALHKIPRQWRRPDEPWADGAEGITGRNPLPRCGEEFRIHQRECLFLFFYTAINLRCLFFFRFDFGQEFQTTRRKQTSHRISAVNEGLLLSRTRKGTPGQESSEPTVDDLKQVLLFIFYRFIPMCLKAFINNKIN